MQNIRICHLFSMKLKINISDIQPIPLDHVSFHPYELCILFLNNIPKWSSTVTPLLH